MKVAKLASRLNWRRPQNAPWPRFFLFTDQHRLADPAALLDRLPRGAAIVLRHTDPVQLAALARRTVGPAHARGLKVLLAGDIRMAIQCGCDGVHFSQRLARRGPPRVTGVRPEFLITVAAHDAASLRRATRAGMRGDGADLVMLSPVFATQSHAQVKGMGVLRFARIAVISARPVVALGGVTAAGAKRLSLGPAYGIAAIGAWRG